MILEKIIAYLNCLDSVSNQEEDFSKFIINNIKSYQHNFSNDKLGNLYFTFNDDIITKSEKNMVKKVCICAHIDEPGLLVTNINSNGTVSFIKQGNFFMFDIINAQVKFKVFDKVFHGVVQYNQKALTTITELNNSKNYFVDFGFCDKKDATSKFNLQLGQVISFNNEPVPITNNRILSNNINNRISVVSIIENLPKLIAAARKNKVILVIAFLVQKQIGNRGAFVVPENICADLYVNLDAFDSYETKGNTEASTWNNFKIGAGPCIQIYDPGYITKKTVQIFLEGVAKKHKIKSQLVFTKSASNCGPLSMATNGQIILPIGFPYRYGLGPNQIVDIGDINHYEKYLVALIKELDCSVVKKLNNIY